MAFSKTAVVFHRQVDPSDPGFIIKSAKLRWLSGYVQSRKPWRDWKPVKVSELPTTPEMTEWLTSNAHVVDGDTIRRGDMTLAWAPIEKIKAKKAEILEQQKVNEASVRSKRKDKHTGMEQEGAEDKF